MTNAYRLYSKEMLPIYLFVCTLFVMGVIFGALLVNAMTLQQKQDVGQYLNAFLSNYAASPVDAAAAGTSPTDASTTAVGATGGATVWEAFGAHARWIFFIWMLGLSVVGVPLILLLDFLKGVLVGFTVGYLAGQWSWKGVVFALASVAPQNLVAVPTIIVASAAAIAFSLVLVRNRLLHKNGTLGRPFAAFSITSLVLTLLLLGVSFFEVYVSPGLLQWATPMLLEGGV
ncbi:stage II sporulation protein M [Paenibacillus sp. TRM 82003]|nr:stage II sporulation protein M [Paenibacillus sp. TRM 82003]